MSKDPRVCLVHILACIEKIERFTVVGKQAFFEQDLIQDAVLRNFEVMGEAAKRIDEGFRANYPHVPWRALAGLRDVLIHQYDRADLGQVWELVENDLPGLKRAIDALVPPLEDLEQELSGEEDRTNSDHPSEGSQ